jgi:protein subunit release factor A
LQACADLMQDSDKDVRKMAEDDLESLREQLDDLQVEIEDEAVPKREIDSRNVTLEIK